MFYLFSYFPILIYQPIAFHIWRHETHNGINQLNYFSYNSEHFTFIYYK